MSTNPDIGDCRNLNKIWVGNPFWRIFIHVKRNKGLHYERAKGNMEACEGSIYLWHVKRIKKVKKVIRSQE